MSPDDVEFTKIKKFKREKWKNIDSRFFVRCKKSKKVLKSFNCTNIKARIFDTNIYRKVKNRCYKDEFNSRSRNVCNSKAGDQKFQITKIFLEIFFFRKFFRNFFWNWVLKFFIKLSLEIFLIFFLEIFDHQKF